MSEPRRVLVFELGSAPQAETENLCRILTTAFAVVRQRVTPRRNLAEAVGESEAGLAFLVSPPDAGGACLEELRAPQLAEARTPVVVFTQPGGPEEILSLLRAGAADFVRPPLSAAEVLPRTWRWLEHAAHSDPLVESIKLKAGMQGLVGESPEFVEQVRKIPLMASCDSTVLICGETGTGKELAARAVHYLGPRARKPFTPVNCGAIPGELLENELFGHEPGAYTGATSAFRGLISETDGGTLFLDEVDSLGTLAQVKLLRFLQEKEYRPLGASRSRRADVRVISATNTDLSAATQQGKFRQDLYYRLNVLPLRMPPLRERRRDIPLLLRHFLERQAAVSGGAAQAMSAAAMEALLIYDWPGNVRELEHVIERALVLAPRRLIERRDLMLDGVAPQAGETFQAAKARVVAQFERGYIEGLLAAYEGNITHAARAARKNRRAFFELMRKHQLGARAGKAGAAGAGS